MSHRHSDSSLDDKLLEGRFHSELRLDAQGNPESRLPLVRGPLQGRSNAVFQHDTPEPQPSSPEDTGPRTVILSTQSPVALKKGTEQLIPRSLAVSSKAKTPARHQSFGAAVLSKEAARRDPRLLPAPSFSLDDMDMGPGGPLARNLRSQSYRAAMRGLGVPGGEVAPVHLSPKLHALAEESTQPPARNAAKNKVGGLWAWTAGWRASGPGAWGADHPVPPCSRPSVSTCRVQAPDSSFRRLPARLSRPSVPVLQVRQLRPDRAKV